jgi:hypothetical protein
MTSVETRKQLILAEANLLRQRAVADLASLTSSLPGCGPKLPPTALLISAFSGIASLFLSRRTAQPNPSGLQRILPSLLDSLRLGADIWVALRRH